MHFSIRKIFPILALVVFIPLNAQSREKIIPGSEGIPEYPGPQGEPDFSKPYASDRIEVAFSRGTPPEIVCQVAGEFGTSVKKRIGRLDVYLFNIPVGQTVKSLCEKIRKHPRAKWVWPDYFVTLAYTVLGPPPNDPYYTNGTTQWNVSMVQADLIWNTPGMMPWAKGLASTVIAVVDTGVYAQHEDLIAKTLTGWNVLANSTDTTDTNGHGTEVASAAGSTANNSKGIAGLAWNCMILPIKAIGPGSTDSDTANGIDYAVSLGASVINCSFGYSSMGATEAEIYFSYYGYGVVTVAGAGNNGTSLDTSPFYPASLPYVISVSGTNSSDTWAGFNYGSVLKCTAPLPVEVADIGSPSTYATWSGTSLATPQVAALVALLLSNGVPYYECVSRVAFTADKVGPNSANTFTPQPRPTPMPSTNTSAMAASTSTAPCSPWFRPSSTPPSPALAPSTCPGPPPA